MRQKLEDTRTGHTVHFIITTRVESPTDPSEAEVGTTKGFIQTGEYPDGRLGEIFIKTGKAGSSEALLDQWAIAFSLALQHGATVGELCEKFIGTRFEPSGPTNVPGVPRCTSPTDLACRFLMLRYGTKS